MQTITLNTNLQLISTRLGVHLAKEKLEIQNAYEHQTHFLH